MKLEVGRRYVLRNGEVTEPIEHFADSLFEGRCGQSIRTWNEFGRWDYNVPGPEIPDSKYDIVAEYVEPDPSHDVQQPLRWVENCVPDKPGIWAVRCSDGSAAICNWDEADLKQQGTTATRCYIGPIPEILPPRKKVVQRLWVNANYNDGTGVLHWQSESDSDGIPSGAGYWIRTDRTREVEQ